MELRIIVVGLGYGAGNPGADNGTGGLLIMCANSIKNNGIISSNGTSGGTGSLSSGGSSGGGSINIFYKEKINKENIYSYGGISSNPWDYGAKRRQWGKRMHNYRKYIYRNICKR